MRALSWGYSSAGRALAWHARGQRFDPAYLHQSELAVPESPSSRGLGHRPFTAVTGVRIPVGTPPPRAYLQRRLPRSRSMGWLQSCSAILRSGASGPRGGEAYLLLCDMALDELYESVTKESM